MVHASVVLAIVACLTVASGFRDHSSLEGKRERQALTFELNQTSGGCSKDQCQSCCCMDTKLEYSETDDEDDTLYKVPFSVAKVGYRDLDTCKGALGSKHDILGACGKSGCKSCEHEGLSKCENTPADTCCRFLKPGYINWRLTLQPWWAMQGNDCNSFVHKAGMGGITAGTADMKCCLDNDVSRGYMESFETTFEDDPAWCGP